MKVSPRSHILARFTAWILERFPPPNWILISVLYLTGLVFGRAFSDPGRVAFHMADVGGWLAAVGFFLMLRVFDEHKDYEIDCQNHPHRVLQRGLITLGHLKIIGAIAIVWQAAWSLYLDRGLGPVSLLWMWVIVWSSLMAKEFFIGEWLKKHIIIYGVSHMLVMPMAMLWWVQMGHGEHRLPLEVFGLAGMSFCAGASFEVVRKTWGPEEERETVDSYARAFGVGRAPLVVIAFVVLSVGLGAIVLQGVSVSPLWPWLAGLGALALLPVVALLKFRSRPSAAARKANEAAVGIFLLLAYALLVTAVLVDRGWAR